MEFLTTTLAGGIIYICIGIFAILFSIYPRRKESMSANSLGLLFGGIGAIILGIIVLVKH